jgi:hypothetical protein
VFEIQPALGNGLDLSGPITDQDTFWTSAKNAGIDFAVATAWGGGPAPNQYVNANLLGAQNNGVATAAYVLLNYFQDESGKYQVDQALAAIGSAQTGLKIVAVDVEDCCGEFVQWKPSHPYTLAPGNDSITDPANHIQVVVTKGTSGTTEPTWNDSGGLTHDGSVTWQDEHVFISQTERIKWISDAVNEISANGLTPIIYTSKGFWEGFTGNCNADPKGSNNCSNLIALPLWYVKPPCGDGIIGLEPFKEFPTMYGWTHRSGNQYQCNYTGLLGVPVDLDYFDPSLFQ